MLRGSVPRTRTQWFVVEGLLLLLAALACTVVAGPPSALALYENTLLRFLLFAIPWLFISGRRDLPSMAGVPSRAHGVALLAIVAVGAALRFGLVPAPYHAFNWMNDLVGRVATEPEPAWYGNGYGIFMWLFTLPGLDPERAIFTGNRVCGLMAPAALFAATRALTGNATQGLCAALLLAVLPLHARLSASESMQIIPAFFLLLAVVGFRGHARSGSRTLLAAGIASFTYAVLTRTDAAVIALALPLAYGPTIDRRRARDPWLWAGVAITAALAGPLAVLGIYNHNATLVSLNETARTFTQSLALAGSPHAIWAIVAAAGFFLLASQGAGWGAATAAVAFAGLAAVAGFDRNPANRLQLLCAQYPWLLVGASAVPATLCRLGAGITRPMAAVGLTVFIAWESARAPFWRVVWDQQQEWAFFERALPLVSLSGTGTRTLVEPSREDVSGSYIPSLPEYRLTRGGSIMGIGEFMARPSFKQGGLRGTVIYYRSLACFETPKADLGFSGPEGWDARQFCEAIESRFRLEPIATAVIDAPPYWATHRQKPVQIGFFRLEPKDPQP